MVQKWLSVAVSEQLGDWKKKLCKEVMIMLAK
jgi:hypothetical protein